jgi:hypothetical protein
VDNGYLRGCLRAESARRSTRVGRVVGRLLTLPPKSNDSVSFDVAP